MCLSIRYFAHLNQMFLIKFSDPLNAPPWGPDAKCFWAWGASPWKKSTVFQVTERQKCHKGATGEFFVRRFGPGVIIKRRKWKWIQNLKGKNCLFYQIWSLQYNAILISEITTTRWFFFDISLCVRVCVCMSTHVTLFACTHVETYLL